MTVGILAAVLLGSGCVGTSHSTRITDVQRSPESSDGTRVPSTYAAASGTPTTLRECGAAAYPGSPDGGVVAGLVWPAGERALGTPAQAYVCIAGFAGDTVTVAPPPGQPTGQQKVQPARLTVPVGGQVLPVSITALASGRVTLQLRVLNRAGTPHVVRTVAVMVADGQRWHFEAAS